MIFAHHFEGCSGQAGNIEDAEMRRTFNMGVGMLIVMTPQAVEGVVGVGGGVEGAVVIGRVVEGEGVLFQEES